MKLRRALAFGFLLLPAALVSRAGEPLVKSGESIAFLGDSITQFGVNSPSGYVNLVVSGLKANGIDAKCVPAGISGHKSNQMLERLPRDVLAKKPAWMTLSCGVNDVWHGQNGVPLDAYQKNIRAIVDQATAAGVRVVILTATMIYEDPKTEQNQKLAAYNDFLRALAKEKGCPLADLNADMQKELLATPPLPGRKDPVLTVDGVHMNPDGNRMMARGILRAFGLDEAGIRKAETAWATIADACVLTPRASVSLDEYHRLVALAAARNQPLNSLLESFFKEAVKDALAASAPTPTPTAPANPGAK